jgi:hypothetical protein
LKLITQKSLSWEQAPTTTPTTTNSTTIIALSAKHASRSSRVSAEFLFETTTLLAPAHLVDGPEIESKLELQIAVGILSFVILASFSIFLWVSSISL